MEKLEWNVHSPYTATSFDPLSLARMRVETYNATPGEADRLSCSKCLGKGTVAALREDGSFYITQCSCHNTRITMQRMERSGIGKGVWDMTFLSFETPQDWQKAMKEGAMTYSRQGQGWFLICGQSGCGKTHLCTAICRNRILRGADFEYMCWRDSMRNLKDFSREDTQEKLMQRLKSVELLYIDDLFKAGSSDANLARPSPADINLTFEILNHRYLNRLSTVISTELQLHDIMTIDEAIGSRITELAGDHIYSVAMGKGRNYRLRHLEGLQ